MVWWFLFLLGQSKVCLNNYSLFVYDSLWGGFLLLFLLLLETGEKVNKVWFLCKFLEH